ncbi:pyridoxamine 5'-phosphate oxidase [Anditalea andensis]|uniref:Pyridoxine/pyridoxamine 5'-phosphate oxidase n=1 Tax=Anditalea andensis TaxID=1048983 RepID=A0A074L0N0_9BACT|nr:pyridoxamine 5'-phosphate oxidase [Anditalea andensis]KEO74025.1 pyridoxine 5'-phosphate oxidase [Anditalea andensis]
MDIAAIRKEYSLKSLDISNIALSPLIQFKAWFQEALTASTLETNAMTISTINHENKPSARVVLLKGIDHGFLFFTNYQSNKGQELALHPYAALTFFWPELERQVRIEGYVEKVTDEESDDYFYSRPLASQIGAWTSPQSHVIPDRIFLKERQEKIEAKFKEVKITRPEHWGGYRVVPLSVEFWQGRPSRLHDRLKYELDETGNWSINRLAP